MARFTPFISFYVMMKWIEEEVKQTLFKENISRFQNIKEDGMRIFRRNESLLQAIALPEEEAFTIQLTPIYSFKFS